MTLPPYTRSRVGEVHHLRCGPQSCRVGLCVRKCPQIAYLNAYGLLMPTEASTLLTDMLKILQAPKEGYQW